MKKIKSSSILSLVTYLTVFLGGTGMFAYVAYAITVLTLAFANGNPLPADASLLITFLIAIVVVRILVILAGVILSAKNIKAVKKNAENIEEKGNSNKKLAIALLIVNFIAIIVSVIGCFIMEEGNIVLFIDAVAWLMLLIANINTIVWLKRNSKKEIE